MLLTDFAISPAPVESDSADVNLAESIRRAREHLLSLQNPAGYWCGELQGDSILESEYILLKFMLRQEGDAEIPRIAAYIRQIQQADGGWNLFPGGPADLSGTVKAYFALKLVGDDPDAPHMARARQIVRSLGGAEKANSFSKIYLAALGQISYDACPSIPPEIVYFPKWLYFNLYHISSWTRVMILPLSIVTTLCAQRTLPPEKGIAELYLDREAANRVGTPRRGIPRTWSDFFLRVDEILKVYDRWPLIGLRQRAIKRAEQWLLAHSQGSEGLGAIFPPMVYMLFVFRTLGYADDDPRVVKAHKDLKDFFIEENGVIRIQPCLSPVWDTGIALHALAESGISANEPSVRSAVDWLLGKECRFASDWIKNCPDYDPADASGWFFEFSNPHYPDTDDTAMAAMSLHRLGGAKSAAAVKRGVKWLLAMQNDDGGWAAFDRTTPRPILEKIPFADHNAMQDPSCPDITGRVLECLGHCGMTARQPAIGRAIAFIQSQQDADGGWWGRWGINYVYGTWQVLAGLRAVGQDMSAPFIIRAATWLRSCQKADGSWGETASSYDDPSLKGKGESTASQTAWGTMGLLAAAGPGEPSVERGIQWLIRQQGGDGNWEENFYTGTGFPRVFYLKYHLYRLYFPLMALARYQRLKKLDCSRG